MKFITSIVLALVAVAAMAQSSIYRYGGLYDFRDHKWLAVGGAKVGEIDLGWKRIDNPEVWAGVAVGNGGSLGAVVAEPWHWTPTITAFLIGSAGVDQRGRFGFQLGGAIQLTIKRF